MIVVSLLRFSVSMLGILSNVEEIRKWALMGGGCDLSMSCFLLFASVVSVHSSTATFVDVRLGVHHQHEERMKSQPLLLFRLLAALHRSGVLQRKGPGPALALKPRPRPSSGP